MVFQKSTKTCIHLYFEKHFISMTCSYLVMVLLWLMLNVLFLLYKTIHNKLSSYEWMIMIGHRNYDFVGGILEDIDRLIKSVLLSGRGGRRRSALRSSSKHFMFTPSKPLSQLLKIQNNISYCKIQNDS